MPETKKITVARGDGIGPEIMGQVLRILQAAKAPLEPEETEIGEAVYKKGAPSGIADSAWESLHRTKVFLKAPVTTPQGGGFRSLNVAIRKTLGLFANIRPCVSYHPFVATKHPNMDITVVRENEEDLYSGMEYRQTQEVFQSLKILSRRGSEKIIRFAFEYARRRGRKKVSCFTKDNIMKIADGMFHSLFEEIAKGYPDIESEHWIVDIGMAKTAAAPELFDVIVVPNFYGDILSDITAQIAGSVGLAGSSNIGDGCAMFEAIHGSAPRRAGQNLANPSGLLQAAIQMLEHLEMTKEAEIIQNAWLKTLEDGIHTYDIYREGLSRRKAGTKEFGQAVIDRLGESPRLLKPRKRAPASAFSAGAGELSGGKKERSDFPEEKKTLAGADVFIDRKIENEEELAQRLQRLGGERLRLESLSCRGLNFWPGPKPLSDKSDSWRCRFLRKGEGSDLSQKEIIDLLSRLAADSFDIVKIEGLYNFNGRPGFSKSSTSL